MIEGGQSGASVRTMMSAATTLNVSLDFLAGLVEIPVTAQDLLRSLQEKNTQILDMRTRKRQTEPDQDMAQIKLMNARTRSEPGI